MRKYLEEARLLLARAAPIMVAQLSLVGMGVVDTVMSGDVSACDMAAVALGAAIWAPVILFGIGLLWSLPPTIAQLDGARKRHLIAHQIQQGVWLALFLSLLAVAVLYQSEYIISHMQNVEGTLVQKAIDYINIIKWGAPGYLLFQVFRNQCDGLGSTKPGMFIGFFGLLANIPLNYIFVHGKLGAPALGGAGCAVATAGVGWIMFFMIRCYVAYSKAHDDIKSQKAFSYPDWQVIKRLSKLGLPIALAIFFEVSLFATVTLLIAPLGVVAVAGHQIAYNFSALMFMLPWAISSATAVRVGFCLGERDLTKAKITAFSGIAIALIIAFCTAVFSICLREPIALLYNKDPEVIALAAQLMLVAAIYQLVDSLQAVGNGILCGYKDTRSILFIVLIAFWVIALPLGYLLAMTNYIIPALGALGFWIGFVFGMISAAIMMLWRVHSLQNQPPKIILQRLDI